MFPVILGAFKVLMNCDIVIFTKYFRHFWHNPVLIHKIKEIVSQSDGHSIVYDTNIHVEIYKLCNIIVQVSIPCSVHMFENLAKCKLHIFFQRKE